MTVLELKKCLDELPEDADVVMSCSYYNPTGESQVSESPLTREDLSLHFEFASCELSIDFDISR